MRPVPNGVSTILVVDDHDGARYATARTLRAAGFRIVEAATGSETLTAAENPVDLVVLDINLPDIDGFEVCRQLRSRKTTADLPVIYLSATFTDVGDQRLGLEAGADSYLTHPVDPTALIATVRALLFAREAQANRRVANARFQAIFEGARTGMAILDSGLRLIEANAALCELLGIERPQAAGRAVADVVSDGQSAPLAALRDTLRTGQSWTGVLAVRREGEGAELEWSIAPDPEGERFIAMVTDVTERRQRESHQQRSLASERAARAEAELSNELKDQFLATLSHELRNPLGAILGWSRILKRTANLPPLLAQGIDAIDRNATVQSHLISDLLDFAGIRFGKMRLEVETFDPSGPVAGAVETMQHQAQQKGIVLVTHPAPQRAKVLGDPSRLQQIAWNLLTNAIKFTPSGGSVQVSTSVDGENWVMAVADTGAGIAAEFLPRLFDRFSQQDSTKAKSFGGLGIGLSIVRHLVDLHGGTVQAHSDGPNRGATFTVRIPLAESTGNHATLDAPDLHGLHVLVVEDGDDTRALIVRLLSEAGAEVAEAASAEAAIGQVGARKPDILVSDIGMAKTDGYALIRMLRSAGYTAEALPAVALTAFVSDEDRREALAAGFQAHLGKPVNAASIVATVARLARDGRASGGLD
ncbi:MAG TPA: response regulator [Steroidobacteraceae bacterium]|nr:response regulator [Steroidobacteraceae bacterium]